MGEIVVSIQFQDIVRQQIEHVVQTLDEIDTFFNDDNNKNDEPDSQNRQALMNTHMILRLQIDQISQVKKEIHNAYRKIKKSFIEIGNEVEHLVTDAKNLNISSSVGGENPFMLLLAGLKQLDNIISTGNKLVSTIEKNLNKSADTAKSLADHLFRMEDISMDLHIKAINALIMSKRLGSNGKTLSILAENVTEVSSDSNEFVLDVVEILKSIGNLAKTISYRSINDNSDSEENNTQNMSLTTGIDMIEKVYNDFITKSKQSIKNSEGLKSRIIQLEPRLEFLNEIEITLSEQLIKINKILEMISPFLPEKNNCEHDFEQLSKRYTMEIERGVHNRAICGERIPEESGINTDQGNTQEETGEDFLGDNIELF